MRSRGGEQGGAGREVCGWLVTRDVVVIVLKGTLVSLTIADVPVKTTKF